MPLRRRVSGVAPVRRREVVAIPSWLLGGESGRVGMWWV